MENWLDFTFKDKVIMWWVWVWFLVLVLLFWLFLTYNKLNQAEATNSIEKIRTLNISKAEKLQKQVINTRDELQKKVDSLNITIRDIEKCKTDNSEKWKAVECLILNK